jgi:alpha-glucosidase
VDPPGKWYLHSFHRGQPDLNWDNPEVRNAIRDVMRFWLDRGVDGFRVDVLWLLGKDPQLRDNSLNPNWHQGSPSWLRLRRDRSEDGPRAHEYVRFLRNVVDEYPDRVMIGEVVLPPERAVAYYGEHLDEAHMPHNFALTEVLDWRADELRAIVEGYENRLPARAWPNWLLGDHDFPRIASRMGRDRVRLVHMLLLTMRGTPTWYYGDELGLPNARVPLWRAGLIDPQAATGPDRDRLAARTPMQWRNDPFGGFSSTEPWLPIASADPDLTVEAQRDDPASVLSLFRSLVGLRKEVPALRVGAYESLPARSNVFSFRRHHPTGSIDVHLNFGEAPREVEIGSQRKVLLSTTTRPTGEVEGTTLTLESHEGVIMQGTDQRGP